MATENNGEGLRQLVFSATYTSPTSKPFTIENPLQAPPSADSVADKTKYLNELRKAAVLVQAQVNKELTARMEEDKARDAKMATNGIDEVKEEENYGEEVQGEEDE